MENRKFSWTDYSKFSQFQFFFIFRHIFKIINMGHVTKFRLIFRKHLRPREKRYRFEILKNEIKGSKVRLYCRKIFKFQKKL